MAFGFPAYHTVRFMHKTSKADCERKVAAALKQLPWKEIGYIERGFDYRSVGTMLTFGERILIFVGENELYIKSFCFFPGQFLDFGKNKQNVSLFLEKYESID